MMSIGQKVIFNRFPIQIGIENDFDEINKNLIIESLTELDNALDGVKFEYYVFDNVTANPYLEDNSYINIYLDEEGKSTIKEYEVPGKEENPYAWARINYIRDFFKRRV